MGSVRLSPTVNRSRINVMGSHRGLTLPGESQGLQTETSRTGMPDILTLLPGVHQTPRKISILSLGLESSSGLPLAAWHPLRGERTLEDGTETPRTRMSGWSFPLKGLTLTNT